VKAFGDVRIHTVRFRFHRRQYRECHAYHRESKQLVLVEWTFSTVYARKFREVADSPEEPIERLYVSHRHPDHWFGLATRSRDVPIYALSETKTFIETNGEASRLDHWKMGDLAPAKVVAPGYVVSPGSETIDGVEICVWRGDQIPKSISPHHWTSRLAVFIPQDLIYTARILPDKIMGNWITFWKHCSLPATNCSCPAMAFQPIRMKLRETSSISPPPESRPVTVSRTILQRFS